MSLPGFLSEQKNLRRSESAMSHSAIAKKQNQILPILFWHLDVGRFHAAGIGVGLGCIFSIDGGWADAIASRLAPTGVCLDGWDLGCSGKNSTSAPQNCPPCDASSHPQCLLYMHHRQALRALGRRVNAPRATHLDSMKSRRKNRTRRFCAEDSKAPWQAAFYALIEVRQRPHRAQQDARSGCPGQRPENPRYRDVV